MNTETKNPANGKVLETYPNATAEQIEQALAQAESAFQSWRARSVSERAAYFTALAKAFRAEHELLAQQVTLEMGKIIAEARAEVEKCASEADYYAEHGPSMLAPEKAEVNEADSYVTYLPLGPLLAVMPWNFPYWQLTRFAIPALLAGNTVILKHASNVSGCALFIQKIFKQAGFPDGVFTTLILPSDQVQKLIEDPRIKGVSLTGSLAAGSKVASQAAAKIKKSVLELGGSDPFIVLKDADIDGAVKAAVKARFGNAGQVCIAAKRFILEAPIAENFTKLFQQAIEKLVTGDPMNEISQIGPLAKNDIREELHAQVMRSVEMGAKLLAGGTLIEGPGYFYVPTLLSQVTRDMPAVREETFGPVAVVMIAKNADEAIRMANDSDFGLSANLWTRDLDLAKRLALQIETGSVFINSFSKSDPRIPIGGIKQSGYGRELSHFGPREFTNVQTTWVERKD